MTPQTQEQTEQLGRLLEAAMKQAYVDVIPPSTLDRYADIALFRSQITERTAQLFADKLGVGEMREACNLARIEMLYLAEQCKFRPNGSCDKALKALEAALKKAEVT